MALVFFAFFALLELVPRRTISTHEDNFGASIRPPMFYWEAVA
jgi:hypothetical protein